MSTSSNEQLPVAAKPLSPAPGLLQRKCGCGNHTVAGGECNECQTRSPKLQRVTRNSPIGDQKSGGVPSIVHEVLRSPGRPLDADTRAFFEPRFGQDFGHVRMQTDAATRGRAIGTLSAIPSNHWSEREADDIARRVARSTADVAEEGRTYDFSGVRVHTDSKAAKSARTMNARAYTVGNDIVFAENQYSAGTTGGRELIAHELAHVVQNGANPPSQLRNSLHRKTLETNESACTATMHYLVQLSFKDEGEDEDKEAREPKDRHQPGYEDKWKSASITRTLQRKATFRKGFKQSIEDAFNRNNFRITPDRTSYSSGLIFKEEKSCPCPKKGFKPRVQIDLVKEGEISISEDWEVDVEANPYVESSSFGRGHAAPNITSSSNQSSADLDEADVVPRSNIAQIPAAHEFGHSIGLHHPGKGIGGNKPNELPEYEHKGKDIKERPVHGPTDLMGKGMGLRPFYFDSWRDELSKKYGDDCGWTINPNTAATGKGTLPKPERSLAPPVSTAVVPR